MELINDSEKLNANTIEFAKQKESELESIIIQKSKLNSKQKKIKTMREKQPLQLEEQKAEEERQRIFRSKSRRRKSKDVNRTRGSRSSKKRKSTCNMEL